MKYINKQEGFSLVEVLAASVLLVVLATAFFGYFINATHAISKTGDQGQNLYIAQQDLEKRTNLIIAEAGKVIEFPAPLSGLTPKISVKGDVKTRTIQGNRVLTEFILNPNP
jgi:prepilin-type N-terminal cleavage/methylation domain-containing protein